MYVTNILHCQNPVIKVQEEVWSSRHDKLSSRTLILGGFPSSGPDWSRVAALHRNRSGWFGTPSKLNHQRLLLKDISIC
jgi:hypothetical protein